MGRHPRPGGHETVRRPTVGALCPQSALTNRLIDKVGDLLQFGRSVASRLGARISILEILWFGDDTH